MKHRKLAIIAGLVAGLVTGFGYAADDGSSASDVLETPDYLLEYVKSTGAQFVDTGIKARKRKSFSAARLSVATTTPTTF